MRQYRIGRIERFPKQTILHIIGSMSRTLLALTFLFSGFVKAVDPLGTVYKVEDYLTDGFEGLLHWADPLAGTLAVLLITTELLLGVTMLFNVRSRWTSWITLIFYLIMTPITLYIAIDNPVKDCGCFGDALVITNWQTFYKNIVLLALAILFVLFRKSIPQLFNWWAELIIALIGLGFAAGIMGYSYTHLPIIDFRPYKVGNNISELMNNGEGAIVNFYYTLEKDGIQQEFLYQDRPDLKGDTTWTKLDQKSRTVTIREAKEPTIKDFILGNEDITEEILTSETPVTLIIMYDLNKVSRKQAEKIMPLYNQCIEHGEMCYMPTTSDKKTINAFAQQIGMDQETAEQVFILGDEKLLKTIIRANPGVVVLKEGVVMEKHNMRQL